MYNHSKNDYHQICIIIGITITSKKVTFFSFGTDHLKVSFILKIPSFLERNLTLNIGERFQFLHKCAFPLNSVIHMH